MVAWTSRERLKRLHSLMGVLPLALFVVVHLGTNAYAIWGRDRFEAHLAWVNGLPGRVVLEIFGIFLPLLLHAGIGIRLMLDPAALPPPPGERRDWGLILQRATGLFALAFVAVHLGAYRWPRAMGTLATTELYDRLSTDLQSMGWFAFYLAGTSAVVFHLAQGVTRFFAPAERRAAPAGRRRLVLLCGTLGVAVWLLSLEVLGQYYAGGSVLGSLGVLRRLVPGGAQ